MAKRIQLRRTKGWRKPEGCVNVARPTKWGNPFKWSNYTQFADEQKKYAAMRDYENWLEGQPLVIIKPKQRQWILAHLHELAGKDLACWCKPGDPCHADVLLELANQGEL